MTQDPTSVRKTVLGPWLRGLGIGAVCLGLSFAVLSVVSGALVHREHGALGDDDGIEARWPDRPANDVARQLDGLIEELRRFDEPTEDGWNAPAQETLFSWMQEAIRSSSRPTTQSAPEEIRCMLDDRRDVIDGARRALRGGAAPEWERHLRDGQFVGTSPAGALYLSTHLLADALVAHEDGDAPRIEDDLRASAALLRSAGDDPRMMVHLDYVFHLQMFLGTVRALPGTAHWKDRLDSLPGREALDDVVIAASTLQADRDRRVGFDGTERGWRKWVRRGQHVAFTPPLNLSRYRLGRQLADALAESPCSSDARLEPVHVVPFGKAKHWELVRHWDLLVEMANRVEVEREWTALVLSLTPEDAGTTRRSAVCPDLAWHISPPQTDIEVHLEPSVEFAPSSDSLQPGAVDFDFRVSAATVESSRTLLDRVARSPRPERPHCE